MSTWTVDDYAKNLKEFLSAEKDEEKWLKEVTDLRSEMSRLSISHAGVRELLISNIGSLSKVKKAVLILLISRSSVKRLKERATAEKMAEVEKITTDMMNWEGELVKKINVRLLRAVRSLPDVVAEMATYSPLRLTPIQKTAALKRFEVLLFVSTGRSDVRVIAAISDAFQEGYLLVSNVLSKDQKQPPTKEAFVEAAMSRMLSWEAVPKRFTPKILCKASASLEGYMPRHPKEENPNSTYYYTRAAELVASWHASQIGKEVLTLLSQGFDLDEKEYSEEELLFLKSYKRRGQ